MPLDMLLNNENYNFLLERMPIETKEKIKRFRFIKDSCRTLFGRVLLQYMLDKYYGMKDYTITYNEYGKPYLKEYNHVHFSISHSGDWIVCVTCNHLIGVDIEFIRPFESQKEFIQLAEMFLNRNEITNLFRQCKDDQPSSFYAYWTGKEAVVKYLGTGIGDVKKFDIVWQSKHNAIATGYEKDLYIQNHTFSDDYRISICTDEFKRPINIEIISASTLINSLKSKI